MVVRDKRWQHYTTQKAEAIPTGPNLNSDWHVDLHLSLDNKKRVDMKPAVQPEQASLIE